MVSLWSIPLFLFLFIGFFHPITAITQDLGRHILTGQIIWQTHHVPKTNLFSYTYPNFPFINHHWGSEVVFYLLERTIGFTGLLIVMIITIFAAFGTIFFSLLVKKTIYPVILLATSLLYSIILFERTDVRPEIFSFLFLALFITILYHYRQHPTRWIFFLIPIETIWVNTHIYFLIGEIVIVLFLLDWVITRLGNLKTKYTLWITLTTISVWFVTIFNPNGISGALYPLHVFSNYGYTIEENQNIFFLQSIMNNAVIPVFEITVVLLFVFLIITIKKTRPIDWFLSVSFTILGAMAIRNFPLFVFATIAPFTTSVSYIYSYILTLLSKKNDSGPKIFSGICLISLLLLVLWKSISLLQTNHIGGNIVSGAAPGADFYLNHHIKGPVFNNFDIGSYLEYRIYPYQKVFVDGRPEAYPAAFFQKVYIPMQQDPQLFNQVDSDYHFNSIFFSHTDQTPWAAAFIKSITTNPQWKLVYLDDTVGIYLKNTSENAPLIKKYLITEKLGNTHIANTSDSSLLFQLAHFYYEAGWINKEFATYEAILSLNPKDCTALYDSLLLLNNQTPLAQEYAIRYQNFCQ